MYEPEVASPQTGDNLGLGGCYRIALRRSRGRVGQFTLRAKTWCDPKFHDDARAAGGDRTSDLLVNQRRGSIPGGWRGPADGLEDHNGRRDWIPQAEKMPIHLLPLTQRETVHGSH